MRKIIISILAFAALACGPAAAEEAWERVSATGEIRWGSDAASPLIGFEADVADLVGKKLNMKSRLIPMASDAMMKALSRDECDIVFGKASSLSASKGAVTSTVPYFLAAGVKDQAEGSFVGILRSDSPKLRENLDRTILSVMKTGELGSVLKKWKMRDGREEGFAAITTDAAKKKLHGKKEENPLPLLIKGILLTASMSAAALFFTVVLAAILSAGSVFSPSAVRPVFAFIAEAIRGIPLLIILLILYYGFGRSWSGHAFWVGAFGIGIYHAARCEETFRAAMDRLPGDYRESAISLGIKERDSVLYVLIPQAIRSSASAYISDVASLIKDTSLVSLFAVTELTYVCRKASVGRGSFLLYALVAAALYIAMTLPLMRLSRELEKRDAARNGRKPA